MLNRIASLFGRRGQIAAEMASRPRLALGDWPAVAYAVGDVHGCYDLLRKMEAAIAADAASIEGDKLIVVLGDVIDRGPDSQRIVSHLMSAPPPGFRRIVLAGNHEQMLLDFVANPGANAGWLELGGLETLLSYGVRPDRIGGRVKPAQLARDMQSLVPAEHLDWMRSLPVLLTLPGHVLVHAGIEFGVPLDEQSDEDLMWLRWDLPGVAPLPGHLVVHGHTPAGEPVVEPARICVDTGAFATGVLSAVRLAPGDAPRILQVRP